MDGRTAAAVLGVAPGATKQELVRAFRARAKQAHPDGAGSDEAFLTLRAAYEYLLAVVDHHQLQAGHAAGSAPVAGPLPTARPRPRPAARSWLTGSGQASGSFIDLTDTRSPGPNAGTGGRDRTAPLGSAVADGARRFADCLHAELARRSA